MPFVIAAGTTVGGSFSTGVQSVNLSSSPQIQRLYQLGSFTPFDKNVIKQFTLNISVYAGSTGLFSLDPSINCLDASSVIVNLNPGSCSSIIGLGSIPSEWWITSYSYSKDIQGWGIEAYSLMSKPEVIGAGSIEATLIRGIAEGQSSIDGGADTGVTFIGTTVEGASLEVSAGTPGIGKAFTLHFGEVSSVGGGTGKADGKEGQASVSVPITPIYIP